VAVYANDYFGAKELTIFPGQSTIVEDAARRGVAITNLSHWEPMVILKHFGPNHPDMPNSLPM
jgi:hypothetical protein